MTNGTQPIRELSPDQIETLIAYHETMFAVFLGIQADKLEELDIEESRGLTSKAAEHAAILSELRSMQVQS